MTEHEYGVDLITFYHPSFWGVSSYDEIMELRRRDPAAVWNRILDGCASTGITAMEMTFPPADTSSATDAFGSAAGFRAELESRGLRVMSSFHMATDWMPGVDVAAEVDRALEHASFLAEAGGDVLVAGPPMRRSRDAQPPFFVDLAFASAFADVAHAVGDAIQRIGVRLALHTEAHSSFCTSRDVELLLTMTDPEYVHFCPDTAHLTLAGGDAVEIARRHRERIIIAHWKDAAGRMPDGPIDLATIHDEHQKFMRPMGEGVVDWPAWAALYDTTQGAAVRLLELDAVPDPIAEMVKAKAFAESIR